METIILIINTIRNNKGLPPFEGIKETTNLREDIGFDSFDLAELTVRIEEAYNVDVFEDGILNTISEVLDRIKKNNNSVPQKN